jgi:uncharacterized repeat protein (TIGR03803 family)
VRELESRLTPSVATLASFLAPGGTEPYAGLVMDGSGNLYGTASHGGAYSDGTVFEVAKGSGAITTLASFNGTNGANPGSTLFRDARGNLYGTTTAGGADGNGTVFELAAGSGTITTLASFNGTDGSYPQGVIMDGSGNLYGVTIYGGPGYTAGDAGLGTVFELAAGSGTITTLASFNGTDGAFPVGTLLMDRSGNLYDTTAYGGAFGYTGGVTGGGTVFEVAKGSGTITDVVSFNGTDGQSPEGGVIMDAAGNLYGTTAGGSGNGYGTVFEVATGSGTITTLASFNLNNGGEPFSGVVMDGGGNLYGTTYAGGSGGSVGTVFEVAAGSGTITTLASFNTTNGANPYDGLVLDGSGNLYGTTFGGSGYTDGTVFEVAKGSGAITDVAVFTNQGAQPAAGLVLDSNGNLYGTTSSGGPSDAGTVFEVAAGSGQITTLASFNWADGAEPEAALILDGSGNLYGTTYEGGASSDGTVFKVAKGSGTITTLASFNGTNGASPLCALVMDGSGNLYGTTQQGGASGDGTVFEVAAGSGAITTLASFDGTNGAYPYAGLVMDGGGNLYGAASEGGPGWNPQGGSYGDGTVFELTKASGAITDQASFDGPDGASPRASLVLDSSGNLYGTATGGGAAGYGTVFELAKGSGTITTLASNSGTDGLYPGGLAMDSHGNLYGTMQEGGLASADYGTVFELAAGGSTMFTLAAFNGTNGNGPTGLILDGNGSLYGTTSQGGAPNLGTVFELPGVAVVDQWTGANAAVDTKWSDGANWATGAPPNPGQMVLFTNNASVKSFTSTVDAGFTNPVGVLTIDSTWGGTITVNSPLSVTGNFTLASGSFGGKGAVAIGARASQWTGGRIVVGAGGFTNLGTLTADTTAGNLVLTGAGTLTNDGTVTEAGANSLVLKNTATLGNAARATFGLTGDGSVSQSGGGTFTNAGLLEKTGGTGTSTISTTTLSNTGTVAVASGTLTVSAAVAQVSGTTLTAGTWNVAATSTVHSTLNITSAGGLATLGSAAQVTLTGLNSAFSNLSGLSTIASGASLSLLGGSSFTTAGALTNNGNLTLSPGSILTVGGSFTQTSTGVLTVELGGTAKSPTFGQVVSNTGTMALGGSLTVMSTVVPPVRSSLELLDNEGNSAIGGAFAGLAEGSTFTVTVGTTTMTYRITYAGKDNAGKHNVVITRIS